MENKEQIIPKKKNLDLSFNDNSRIQVSNKPYNQDSRLYSRLSSIE